MFAPAQLRSVPDNPDDDLIARIDVVHARVGAAERELLELIALVDATDSWERHGARDTAHWLAMRYGISTWKAQRWIRAAHALEDLPRTAAALATGRLGMDKVVELCRFATPRTEVKLIRWATRVAAWAVRCRADRERAVEQTVRENHAARSLIWWYEQQEGTFALSAHLPADQGAVVVEAIETMARRVPTLPGEDDDPTAPERCADALVALCSSSPASEHDPVRANMVVHVRADDLVGSRDPIRDAAGERAAGGEVEGGPVLHPETVRRLACDARIQTVIEDRAGEVLAVRAMSREPTTWMLRQLQWRDQGCRFPGCGARAFTQAHHIVFWSRGGATELSNLLLICFFHHRLVHEQGWSIRRAPDGELTWLRPGGATYRAGPAP
ncbi:MAG: DUF222 domain-containing protein [Actinomycetota bacterium]